ncbi:hypothetical protein L810_5415 [Burkholderia sp. AU4i]|nr:hypothetical protein L810_5415 [Burkholderia sp. AU4i]QOH36011.1 hypothetical protein C7S14_8008 [Burkholderia cepacia]
MADARRPVAPVNPGGRRAHALPSPSVSRALAAPSRSPSHFDKEYRSWNTEPSAEPASRSPF